MRALSRRGFLRGLTFTAATLTWAQTQAARTTADLRITSLGPLTWIKGGGCNVVALPGPDGMLLVDGGWRQHSAALLRAAKKATKTRRVHTLINTHWHPEQTGSNELASRDAAVLFAHEKTRLCLGRALSSSLYQGTYGPLPERARPTQTTRGDGSFEFASQPINYGYLPQAHTDGDLYVHFREPDILVAGGPLDGRGWPLLDIRNGAWIGGLLRAYEKLLTVVGPSTQIVSAHGGVYSRADIERHHAMYATLFERLVGFLNEGMGPDDVIERRAAAEYEGEMGDAAEFLDRAFRSLSLAYAPD